MTLTKHDKTSESLLSISSQEEEEVAEAPVAPTEPVEEAGRLVGRQV